MRFNLLFIALIFNFTFAQESTLHFFDRASKEPIVGAKIQTIYKNGTTQNHLSNPLGTITLSEHQLKEIHFHFLNLDTLLLIENNIPDTFYLPVFKTFEKVVVTGKQLVNTTNETIEKVTIITEEDIRLSGATNLAEVLLYQSSLRIGQDQILGASASINGISGENIKLLIDGIPVIGRQNGNIDLSQINLNDVERIEIIEGPMSVNYGSNALGGTINIITKKGREKGVQGNLNLLHESTGKYVSNLRFSSVLKKNRFSLSLGRIFFDGWDPDHPTFMYPKKRLADTNRAISWNIKEQYNGRFSWEHFLHRGSFGLSIHGFSENILNRGMPDAPYYINALDDYYLTQRGDINLFWNQKFKKITLTNQLSAIHYYRIKNTYKIDLTTLNQDLSQSENAHDTSRFNLVNWRGNFTYEYNRRFHFSIGTDFTYESAYGERIESNSQEILNLGSYILLNYKINEFIKVEPGIRYDYNSIYATPLTPALGLSLHNKNKFLKIKLAQGFRAPSIKELYFEFVDVNHNIIGNTDLKPESSIHSLISIGWNKQTQNTIHQIELSGFYNSIENLITLGIINSTEYTYVNIGLFRSTGGQVKYNFQNPRVNATAQFNLTGRYNALATDFSTISNYNFTPDISLQLKTNLYKKFFGLAVFGKYSGSLNSYLLNEEGSVEITTQSDYTILDASFYFNLLHKKLQLNLGAHNLLNVTSITNSSATGGVHGSGTSSQIATGRSYFISLNYTLKNEK